MSFLFVALGGALGAVARYAMGDATTNLQDNLER